MFCSLLERQHETTAFHLLGSGGNLLMKKAVDINTAHLNLITLCILPHQDSFEAITCTVDLRGTDSRLAVRRLGALLLSSHGSGYALPVLLGVQGLVWLIGTLTLGATL